MNILLLIILSNHQPEMGILLPGTSNKLDNGVFPIGNRNSANSANSENRINHWSQFKDPVSHMCVAGAVAAS